MSNMSLIATVPLTALIVGKFLDNQFALSKFYCRGVSHVREWPRYCRKVYWPKLVQNGPDNHFEPFWPYSKLDFSIRETKMDQNGPFWPEEVHFGPFRSANRTLVIPDMKNIVLNDSPLCTQFPPPPQTRKFFIFLVISSSQKIWGPSSRKMSPFKMSPFRARLSCDWARQARRKHVRKLLAVGCLGESASPDEMCFIVCHRKVFAW